jgi:hypothetical protein
LKLVHCAAPPEQPTVVYPRRGQTLEQLCHEKYGDTGYVEGVARYNAMPSLFSIKEGQAIRLPSKAQIKAMREDDESGANGLMAQIRAVAQAKAAARAKAR